LGLPGPGAYPQEGGGDTHFIRRGEAGTETLLIKALQYFGYIRLAENFARCGQPDLARAGREWLQRQGLPLETANPGKPLRWGKR
jgi:hypothetical protein